MSPVAREMQKIRHLLKPARNIIWAGDNLPVHTTFDVSAGRSLGERWTLSASVLIISSHRVLLDNSIAIGGFHFNDPRMISAELRYRFRFLRR